MFQHPKHYLRNAVARTKIAEMETRRIEADWKTENVDSHNLDDDVGPQQRRTTKVEFKNVKKCYHNEEICCSENCLTISTISKVSWPTFNSQNLKRMSQQKIEVRIVPTTKVFTWRERQRTQSRFWTTDKNSGASLNRFTASNKISLSFFKPSPNRVYNNQENS